MPKRCTLCRRRQAERFGGTYCRPCFEQLTDYERQVDLPEGHPFTEERRRRVERMRARAEMGLPIFEELIVDLL
jgi:hypothetical protein